jgi:LuxR family transcriptional regulator, quorum-sensing system regulator CviR
MKLERILSKRDAILLLELVGRIAACTSDSELRRAILKLKDLIPFEHATCLLARIDAPDGLILPSRITNINYSAEWVKLYMENQYHTCDPVFIENFSRFGLQNWSATFRKYNPPKEFLFRAASFGLRKGYTQGLRNIKGDTGSLMSISGETIELNVRTETVLGIVMPHIHQALLRLDREHRLVKNASVQGITAREREILDWIKWGKNTWDISILLGISERTVKFHVKSIMRKLDALSRAQAVAVAIQTGIIDLD